MDEKIIAEMTSVLRDLRDKLGTSSFNILRGPVSDPGPDWGWQTPSFPRIGNLRGPVGDPAPWYLLDKSRVAKLKIRQIKMAMEDLKKQMEYLELEQNLLKEEFKLK